MNGDQNVKRVRNSEVSSELRTQDTAKRPLKKKLSYNNDKGTVAIQGHNRLVPTKNREDSQESKLS